MRQAGRWLPEYRELKTRYDFTTLVRTPALAAEVTLQPVRRFPLDAAILFSDILVVPEALGQGYRFRENGGGLEMEFHLRDAAQIEALCETGVRERLDYMAQALRLIRAELDGKTALLGFAGSPWTLATYMVGGGGEAGAARLRSLAAESPAIFETLMGKLANAVAACLRLQIENGADAVQIFDSWGFLCGEGDYGRFSLEWIRRIIAALPAGVPVIVFAKGMSAQAEAIAAAGAGILSVDSAVRLSALRARLGPRIALQGNLDPSIMESDSPAQVREAVQLVLADAAGMPGHIFNLGHGMPPAAKLKNAENLLEVLGALET
jgi:uroporphyrinogen decarboxylase